MTTLATTTTTITTENIARYGLLLEKIGERNKINILHVVFTCESINQKAISEKLGITQTRAAKHLKDLREAKVIIETQEKQWKNYSISPAYKGFVAGLFEIAARIEG